MTTGRYLAESGIVASVTPGAEESVGQLQVSRARRGSVDLFRAYRVLVDGEDMGEVKRGQSRLVHVAPGRHEVHLAIDWCRSPSIEVDVAPGENVKLACWPKFQVWQMQRALANPDECIVLAHNADVDDELSGGGRQRDERTHTTTPTSRSRSISHAPMRDTRPATTAFPLWMQRVAQVGMMLSAVGAILEFSKGRPAGGVYALLLGAIISLSYFREKRREARCSGTPGEFRAHEVYGLFGCSIVGVTALVLAALGATHSRLAIGGAGLVVAVGSVYTLVRGIRTARRW